MQDIWRNVLRAVGICRRQSQPASRDSWPPSTRAPFIAPGHWYGRLSTGSCLLPAKEDLLPKLGGPAVPRAAPRVYDTGNGLGFESALAEWPTPCSGQGELFRKYAKELRIYHVSFDFLHVSIFHRPSGDLDCGLTMVHWLVYWFTTSQQRGEPDLSKTSSAVPNCSCPGLVAASFDCISPASGLPHRSLVLNSEAQGRRTFIVRPHRMTAHGILLVYCRSP